MSGPVPTVLAMTTQHLTATPRTGRVRALLTVAAAVAVLAGCELTTPTTVASPPIPVPTASSARPSAGATPPSGPQQALVNGLHVRTGRPVTGYQRSAFGQAWSDDVDIPDGHNGCDTRIT